MMTWAQLGRHKKPILIANIKAFWEPLCALLEHMREMQFIRPGLTVTPLVTDSVDDILPKLREAARALSKPEKEMQAADVERM
jgi:predicted Rossmann-fold nucleotide-binding protein